MTTTILAHVLMVKYADNWFSLKTNSNLWTSDLANLKSLPNVGLGIHVRAKTYLDHQYQQMQWNNATCMYVACQVSILTIYAKNVAPPTKSMSQMAAKTLEQEQPAFWWKRQAYLQIVNEKRSYRRCLLRNRCTCLTATMVMAPYYGRSMSAIQLTSLSHNLVSIPVF